MDPSPKKLRDAYFRQLAGYVAPDGVIVLGGCRVGADKQVMQLYAESAGRVVIGYTGNVGYTKPSVLFDEMKPKGNTVVAFPRSMAEDYGLDPDNPVVEFSGPNSAKIRRAPSPAQLQWFLKHSGVKK